MMKTLQEIAIEKLRTVRECPCCDALRLEIDEADPRDWRSPDDVFAIRFECTGEMSVTLDHEITSRRPCCWPLYNKADNLNDEATEEFEAQEGA
ncbi:hypothetical protein [Rhizobium sp. PAMB 3182]